MDFDYYKKLFIKMANDFEFILNIDELIGIDCYLPILQKIREDSGIVIIKFDGEREDNIFTLLASGKNLGKEESIRLDTSNLEGGLAYICVEYAKIAWGWKVSS